MEEDRSVTSGGGFIIKNPPQWDVGGAVRPRTKPKPKVKSKTVSGIALPGLADALIKKQIATENKVGPSEKQFFLERKRISSQNCTPFEQGVHHIEVEVCLSSIFLRCYSASVLRRLL